MVTAEDVFADCPRVGMGCWAIGGPCEAGGLAVGYGETDDQESRRTIEAAWDAGVRIFDTAAAYGAGHSERLLGETIGNRPDAVVVTKFGPVIDEARRRIVGEALDAGSIRASALASRERLKRDQIEVLLCHKNTLEVSNVPVVFDTLEQLRSEGVIGAYGWSTDFPARLEAAAHYEGFVAVEHAMNVFFDAALISGVANSHQLAQVIRSPLAMGLLTGKFRVGDRVDPSDVRSNTFEWMDYFRGGEVSAAHVAKVEAVRELLTYGGRTVGQGALSWLLGKSSSVFPVPGAKTVEQVRENAKAAALGPLPSSVMGEIEGIIDRPAEGPPRER
ncbi:MAG: aldo/keto reductase [Rhodobacter sp.]|nr:aldo/keto reductase [Rhodobacter sp.]